MEIHEIVFHKCRWSGSDVDILYLSHCLSRVCSFECFDFSNGNTFRAKLGKRIEYIGWFSLALFGNNYLAFGGLAFQGYFLVFS